MIQICAGQEQGRHCVSFPQSHVARRTHHLHLVELLLGIFAVVCHPVVLLYLGLPLLRNNLLRASLALHALPPYATFWLLLVLQVAIFGRRYEELWDEDRHGDLEICLRLLRFLRILC